jgi:hypothetical protein
MPYPPRRSTHPLRTLSKALQEAYRSSPLASSRIALCAGFPHHATFSYVINADVVRATPLTIERLQRVADVLGFPRDAIFLPEPVDHEVTR